MIDKLTSDARKSTKSAGCWLDCPLQKQVNFRPQTDSSANVRQVTTKFCGGPGCKDEKGMVSAGAWARRGI